jgi:exodeoxyribonuclease III
MKLATWNVNSLAIRLPQVLAWLEANRPDALCLQETKLGDDKFPHAEIAAVGYRAEWFGQRTYNGVATLTRGAAIDVVKNIPDHDDGQARVVGVTVDGVRIINAYVPNGQTVGSDKYAYKLRWLDVLRDWLADEMQRCPKLALVGDYNIAPEDRDVHDPAAWAGQVLCSDDERARFQALAALGLHDAFRLFEQPPKSYSWWDYRMLGFQKNKGLRIDHILVSAALKPAVVGCTIDRQQRKHERPSDHAPVVAEFDLG